ncbi:hypothetical protein MVEN_02122600 [Mycena venus]|uniref:Uncharacterized protein n=1 Tax=Mycena venus TaxID=2733690 RepID=A0A8H6X9B9_9AGAR|nr:hypothetical protein MVEN_02122600 [Mycena venus]
MGRRLFWLGETAAFLGTSGHPTAASAGHTPTCLRKALRTYGASRLQFQPAWISRLRVLVADPHVVSPPATLVRIRSPDAVAQVSWLHALERSLVRMTRTTPRRDDRIDGGSAYRGDSGWEWGMSTRRTARGAGDTHGYARLLVWGRFVFLYDGLQISEYLIRSDPLGFMNSFISKSGCNLQAMGILGKRYIREDSYRIAFPSIQNFSFDATHSQ